VFFKSLAQWKYFLVPLRLDIDNNTLFICQTQYNFILSWRQGQIHDAFVRSLNALILDIIDIRALKHVDKGKTSFFVSDKNESTIPEDSKSSHSTLQLVVVKVIDFGLTHVDKVDVASFGRLIIT
jgi:hypothetical protein